jgi:hypothetical protein
MLSETQTTTKPPHAPPPPPYTYTPFTFSCKGWSYKKKPKFVHSQVSQVVTHKQNLTAPIEIPRDKHEL